jgi:hypothetical protein
MALYAAHPSAFACPPTACSEFIALTADERVLIQQIAMRSQFGPVDYRRDGML